jgi:hypothetical protein
MVRALVRLKVAACSTEAFHTSAAHSAQSSRSFSTQFMCWGVMFSIEEFAGKEVRFTPTDSQQSSSNGQLSFSMPGRPAGLGKLSTDHRLTLTI